VASIPLSDGTVAVDDGSTPDVLTFNSLFVPDPQFTVIKDIFSPVKLIDVKIGGSWVTMEDLGIADLVLEVSLTDSTKAKEKDGKITFFDPDGALTESEIISEGVELRIGLGFLGDVRNFGTWALEEVSPQLGEDSLTIQCGLKPKSVFMDKTDTPEKWDNLTASEIVKRIAAKYGLTPNVTETGEIVTEFIKSFETDISVVDKLAAAYGYQWYVQDNTLNFHPQDPKVGKLELIFWPGERDPFRVGNLRSVKISSKKDAGTGKCISKNRVETKSGTEVEAVSDVENDPEVRLQLDYFKSLGEEAVPIDEFYGYEDPVTGENVPFNFYMNSVNLSGGGSAVLNSRITAAERASRKGLTLSAECSYGITSLDAGTMIPIKGIGKKYSGLWKLMKVTHKYDNSGYHTTIDEAELTTRAKGKSKAATKDGATGGRGTVNAESIQTDRGAVNVTNAMKVLLDVTPPGE